MKLARELSKRQTGRTLYLLDEPTTGLHFDDVRKLLEVLHRLADLGNTVIIIEHNLDVIRNADWVLDLGPEGGEDGGRVVGEGRPATIAATPGSYTGQFLMRYYTGADGRLMKLEPEDDVLSVESENASNQTSPESNPPEARTTRSGKQKATKKSAPRIKKTGRP
jgi:excinuclease ABC subunit A